MGQASWWVMDLVLPAILLIALIWLVMRVPSNRTDSRTEAGTRDLYREEEERRREGTDEL